jgi:thiamine-phosphate pyrophosphorylase
MKPFEYHMISDRSLFHVTLSEVAADAERAGVNYFQLREKDLAPRDLLSLAEQLRTVLRKTRFIVNGSVEVALASKADGVHLRKDSVPVSAVRSRYNQWIIGYSAHSLEEMKNAEEQGASYLFISPVFQPLSKTETGEPLGMKTISSWCKSVKIPVFALGGVSVHNLSEIRQAGCAGAAGISMFIQNGLFSSHSMVSS